MQLTATVVEMAGARVGLSMLATRVMLRDGMTIDGGMRWRLAGWPRCPERGAAVGWL
ncbi:hypothetical protein PCAR4_760050 [Paraburkholderia caribensis]|nr:hypothetical protein PCAR4_760050 [Paraburkholderia caribensis]